MPTLTIDNQTVTVAAGTTILQAARRLGITIPTLCVLDPHEAEALARTHAACGGSDILPALTGHEPFTSCPVASLAEKETPENSGR
jgi:hypothetical protein